jgi:FAD/FMN-containing dehydrogenase
MSILASLQEVLPERAFGPGSTEYDAGAHVFAGVGAPDAVVRPRDAAEVAVAVRVAAAEGAAVAVRSGGHGSPPATGGVLIDLAELADVSIGDGGVVAVGGGARWGDVADALAPHGLGLSSGDTREVGVGGLALGGGIGWLVRQQGLTIDALRSVELVTAAGEVLEVSEAHRPELFWALRGGGGNFGVATRFTFQATPTGELVGGHLRFDQSDVPTVLRAWRETVLADRELNSTLMIIPAFAPGMPAGPMVAVARAGTEFELREALAPLLALPSLTEQSLAPVGYAKLLEQAPPGKPPLRFAGGNGLVPDLSDELLEACAAVLDRPVPTMLMLRALGGAYSAVAPDATAFAHRPAEALLIVNAALPPTASDEEVAAALEGSRAVLAHTSGIYGNFSEVTGDEVIAAMYPPETLARLRAVKAEIDPHDVFRPAHHIAPAPVE